MKLTNKKNLPEVILDAIRNDDYDNENKTEKVFSATDLINPIKVVMLRRKYAEHIVEDASDKIWSLLGQATHSIIGRAENNNRLMEERLMEEIIDGFKVSGKFDMYEDGIVFDFKVTSVWSIIYKSRYAEWEEQLNVYAWLLKKAGFEVKGLKIIAILRDWSATNAKRDANYPDAQVEVIELKLWTEQEQYDYIVAKMQERIKFVEADADEIPECTPEERWQSNTTYAVKKDGRQKALKVCASELEAIDYINGSKEKGLFIEERQGEAKRCKEYCNVCQFCNYYKENIAKGGEEDGE